MNTQPPQIPEQIVEIWQRIVDTISSLLNVPHVLINRLSPSELEVFRSNARTDNPYPEGTRIPLPGVFCEKTAARRQGLVIQDARQDPAWADTPVVKAGLVAYLGYPLCWPSGEIFGTLCAIDTQENTWLKPSEDLLQTVRDAVEAHLALAHTLQELAEKNRHLEQALADIKTLQGLLPICAVCKKIRDDQGYWNQMEAYISSHADVRFSHGICPQCLKTMYPEDA